MMKARPDGRIGWGGAALVVLALAVPGGLLAQPRRTPDVEVLLRGRMDVLRERGVARAGGDLLLAVQALPRFYEARAFEPAWLGPRSSDFLDQLEQAIGLAAEQGLDPKDYHPEAISSLRAHMQDGSATDEDRADLDLLASDAFMVLGSHLLQGRVNPETLDPEWLANRRAAALDEVLERTLTDGAIRETLLDLAPRQPRYLRMVEAARRLHQLDQRGGWPTVSAGPKLEMGSEGGRVAEVRARLRASGDLPAAAPERAVFDERLAEAIRRFQARHGLAVDGVVGAGTVAQMNVSAGERTRQVETNLERWRWLPNDLGERHVEVNIAAFEVRVVEDGRVVQLHKAVVGRQYRQTPIFSGTMTYLVLSPYWHVPPTIAAVDKLPILRSDPASLTAQGIVVLDQRTNEPVDPMTVDWSKVTGAELNQRYHLRQDPGPYNALGAVKFMFPNAYNVYLHDTPSRELFERTTRDFSSGCIRIDHPLDLAEYLLADQPEWTRARINSVAAGGVERVVRLTHGVPVHLLYWTAWVDDDGTLNFRPDIYGRDRTVSRALDAPPPGL